MEYFTTTAAASRRTGGCVIVGLYTGNDLSTAAADVDAASGGLLSKLSRQGDLSGKTGSCTVLPAVSGVRAQRVAVVGLGPRKAFGITAYRKAIEAAVRAIKDTKGRDACNYIATEEIDGADAYLKARYAAESAGNVLYRFSEMKSGRKPKASHLTRLGCAVESRSDTRKANLGAEHGDAFVAGMNLCRDLGNLPGNVATPSYLARTAQKMAKRHKQLETKVLGEAEMKRLKMGSLLSVTNGTEEPAKMIIMTYRGAGRQAPAVLVGKGVTFDSGGISIKPGPAMDEMKFDMCGAASVIGTMETIATLQPRINLTVVVPACENLPSGRATKPGDIVNVGDVLMTFDDGAEAEPTEDLAQLTHLFILPPLKAARV